MLGALTKAIAQLSDPPVRRVLKQALAASFALFLVLWLLVGLALAWGGGEFSLWLELQGVDDFWVGLVQWLAGAAAVGGVLIVSFLVFPAVVGLVMTLFLDRIARAVEARHYPELAPGREQPVGEMLADAGRLALITVVLNLLALPLYLVALFIPGMNLILFYGLNGYLLGREYYELVAVRRLDSQGVRRLWRERRGRLFVAGIVIAIILTIPIVNLLAPVVATGFMLHVFEAIRRRSTGGSATT